MNWLELVIGCFCLVALILWVARLMWKAGFSEEEVLEVLIRDTPKNFRQIFKEINQRRKSLGKDLVPVSRVYRSLKHLVVFRLVNGLSKHGLVFNKFQKT